MSANVAVVLASVLWLGCMWWDRSGGQWRKLEFWWTAVVLATGGTSALVTFPMFDVSGDMVTYYRTLPSVAIGGLLILQTAFSRPTVRPWGIGLLAFFGILLAHVVGGEPPLMPVLSLLLFAPVILVPTKERRSLDAMRAGAALGTAATLLVVSLLTLTAPAQMVGACRFDKCSMFGSSLGAVGQGNALGLFFAAACAVTLLSTRHFATFAGVAAAGYVLVDLTTSRSGQAAVIIGIIAAACYHLTVRLGRLWVAWVAFVTVTVAVAVFPYLGWSGFDLTGRAILWDEASRLFERSALFGYGSSYWLSDVTVPVIVTNYSAHSFVPEMLVSAGAVGLAALILAIGAAVLQRRDVLSSAYTVAMFTIVLGLSLTEVPSAPGRVYLFPGLIVLAFMTADAITSRDAGKTPRGERERLERSPLQPDGPLPGAGR